MSHAGVVPNGDRIRRADPAGNLRVSEDAVDFRKKRKAHDELERSVTPHADQLGRRTAWREERRDQNVRVEYGAHRANALPTTPACLGDRLLNKRARRVLIHLVLSPKAIKQIETQITAKGALDHLCVGSAVSGSPNSEGPEEVLVDQDCGANARHRSVIAL